MVAAMPAEVRRAAHHHALILMSMIAVGPGIGAIDAIENDVSAQAKAHVRIVGQAAVTWLGEWIKSGLLGIGIEVGLHGIGHVSRLDRIRGCWQLRRIGHGAKLPIGLTIHG